MMSTQVLSAVGILQASSVASAEGYAQDLADRALDELVRHPDCVRPVAFQIRSARANAAKVLRSRRAAFEHHILRNTASRPGVERPYRLAQVAEDGVAETLDWLARTPSLTYSQRRLLGDLAAGHDATSLAARDHLPLSRVQERISRARRVGWAAYQAETLTP